MPSMPNKFFSSMEHSPSRLWAVSSSFFFFILSHSEVRELVAWPDFHSGFLYLASSTEKKDISKFRFEFTPDNFPCLH